MNNSTRKAIRALCALMLSLCLAAALAEADMPVAVDVPYTEEELAEAEAREAEQVAEAQGLLISLGYLTGTADGVLGPRTAAAITDFQAAKGLKQTGALNDETLSALRELSATAADAKALQERLVELGYMRGKVDGIFGERSQAALRLFQTFQGLEATGEADDATREKLFAEDAAALPERLSRGDKGDAVTALQEKLKQFGFLTGAADGSYGAKTASAVQAFQRHLQAQGYGEDLGITDSGEATPATQALLFDPEYSSYAADLAVGDTGDEAQRVERRLGELGYMDLAADTVFDDYAAQSADAFKAAAGLSGDAYDKAFIDALFTPDAPVAEHYVLHDIAYGDTGDAVRQVQAALMRGGMTVVLPSGKYGDDTAVAIGELYAYLSNLGRAEAELFADANRVTVEAQEALENGLLGFEAEVADGSNPAELLRVQRRLHTLYYISKSDVDGIYGDVTRKGIAQFQRANGLSEISVADANTQKRMFSDSAVTNPRKYRVEVDIDNQRVYVFQRTDSGAYEQVKTFICSTGLYGPTPRGIYLDGFPVDYWHHFRDFDVWAQYAFEIEGNIMFHSVLYSEKNVNTLREGSLYALGQKASHGCVRLKVADAKWLFQNCKRGTLVIVIY